MENGLSRLSERFGLSLTETQELALVARRDEVLREMGRIEFGPGILRQLADAFCDSRHITQDAWLDTLMELTESFYYFKQESCEMIPDDELIAFMRDAFEGPCEGSVTWLRDVTLETLCRGTRYGVPKEEERD